MRTGSRLLLGATLILTLLVSHEEAIEAPPPEAPVVHLDDYGIDRAAYRVEEQAIRRNQTFSDILSPYRISPPVISRLAEKARPVFDLRRLRAGNALHIYRDHTGQTAQLVIYEATPETYVVFDLRDSLQVYEKRHPITVRKKTVTGVITSSPYQALEEQETNPSLAIALSNVFAWQIDFYRIQRGDRFTMVYEEREVRGQSIGTGKILAARFQHTGKDYYAFFYDESEGEGYYDEQGNLLRNAFLKAPLEYSRISSRYTKRRFHPVLKRYRAHLGTDYAAPTGTPIRATADGVVNAAAYTKGNGRYVKIKHDKTYTTGYLHMSRFANGIRAGVRVRQGDVIGYVGSTGLATGPHLCYRFWKNGTQVDPLKLDLPSAQPIAPHQREQFFATRDLLLPTLHFPNEVLLQLAARPGTGPGTLTAPPLEVTAP